jgi:hypothetical protein
MVRLDPVVGVKQAYPIVFFSDREKSAKGARRIPIVGVIAIEPDMPDAGAVDPVLRHAIGDNNVVGRY